MNWPLAIWALVVVIVVEVGDYFVQKHLRKKRQENAIEINARCDQVEHKADAVAQEIRDAINALDWSSLPEEQRAQFEAKYNELLDTVNRVKDDVERIRGDFPMEGVVTDE